MVAPVVVFFFMFIEYDLGKRRAIRSRWGDDPAGLCTLAAYYTPSANSIPGAIP